MTAALLGIKWTVKKKLDNVDRTQNKTYEMQFSERQLVLEVRRSFQNSTQMNQTSLKIQMGPKVNNFRGLLRIALTTSIDHFFLRDHQVKKSILQSGGSSNAPKINDQGFESVPGETQSHEGAGKSKSQIIDRVLSRVNLHQELRL